MPLFGSSITQAGWTSQTQTMGPAPILTWIGATGLGSTSATTASAQAQAWVTCQTQTCTTIQIATNAAQTAYFQQGVWVDHQQYLALAHNRVAYYRERTEQERAAQAAAENQRAEESRRRHAIQVAALARSKELLLEHLTAAQRATFEKNGWFVVVGGKTKQSYRIRTNTYAGNIDVLNGSKVSHRLCVHCRSDIPLFDHHLAQKLCLQYDEEHLLSIANRQLA
jgi:hypothetical protein